jgi:hypothetical protein
LIGDSRRPIGGQIEYLLRNRGWHSIWNAYRFSLRIFLWNDSRLNFEDISDLEGFKPFSDGFELTPSFALDTTGASLI